jgi:Tfp pilus assembly protein FimT
MNFRILALLICLAVASFAQTFRGAIEGTVLDSTGASIAGAQVTVTSLDTNLVRQVTADDNGNYAATELPLGMYHV